MVGQKLNKLKALHLDYNYIVVILVFMDEPEEPLINS